MHEHQESYTHTPESGRVVETWPPIDTDVTKVAENRDKLENLLKSLGWSEEEYLNAMTVFEEWMKNAIIHGNMGLFGQEGESIEQWEARLQAAQDKPEVKAKHVYVKINATPTRYEIQIQDEGKNSKEFWREQQQVKTFQNPTGWVTGRGWLLSDAFTNKIDFEKNTTGIKVTIIRDLSEPLLRDLE